MDEEGVLVPGAELPFTVEEAVDMYRLMLRASAIDEYMYSIQRQGRISFYMTNTGEEAAQVGSAAGLDMSDVIWPQYRELGVLMYRGFSVQQIVDQCMSRSTDPGKGRQMPVHYCAADINIQAVTSPLATQIPHASGAGYAFKIGGEKRCAVAYFGDGAASEGDAIVAFNFAAVRQSQTLFVCRNNGWAISTPVHEQYCGDGIGSRGLAFGIDTIRVDGNDLAAVYAATKMARNYCVTESKPVVLELMTYRRGHHSTSDDANRYRPEGQLQKWGVKGVEPLGRVRAFLERQGYWDQAQEDATKEKAVSDVKESISLGEDKKMAPVHLMFKDVYATVPPHLEKQYAELKAHIERHPEAYDLSKYEGV